MSRQVKTDYSQYCSQKCFNIIMVLQRSLQNQRSAWILGMSCAQNSVFVFCNTTLRYQKLVLLNELAEIRNQYSVVDSRISVQWKGATLDCILLQPNKCIYLFILLGGSVAKKAKGSHKAQLASDLSSLAERKQNLSMIIFY